MALAALSASSDTETAGDSSPFELACVAETQQAYAGAVDQYELHCLSTGLYYAGLKKTKTLRGAARLIWADPWYQKTKAPTDADLKSDRKLVDHLSSEGTVVVLWCTAEQIASRIKFFQYSGEKDARNKHAIWYVDTHPFVMVRDPRAGRAPRQGHVMAGLTEYAVIAYRQKPAAKKAGKKSKLGRYVNAHKTYSNQLYDVIPSPACPHGTNVLLDYKPPAKQERLRDRDGKILRACAEKSAMLACRFILMFTRPGDLVVDLYAGTASMGLACIMTGRNYSGVEIDEEVVEPARLRMGRLLQSVQKKGRNTAGHFGLQHTSAMLRIVSAKPTTLVLGKDNRPKFGTSDLVEACGPLVKIEESQLKVTAHTHTHTHTIARAHTH